MLFKQEHELWRAGVDLCGPSNLTTFIASEGGPRRYVAELGNHPAALRELSPLHRAAAIRTPLFVYQGGNDARVPRLQSDTIVEALRARGARVVHMVAANEGHTLARRGNRIEHFTRVLSFLASVLEL
ncbi:MAG: prolyl oligopeptidase family serine peptidase [Sandaracinaceae bacterium]|nr:prolyl oligopeptidase family serine peptidase [Sandaracinaceae bacterium]